MHTHISTEQLSLALDRRLPPHEQTALHEHVSLCAACRQEWESWQALANRLEQAPLVYPAPGFVQRFEKRLQQRQAAQHGLLGGVVLLTGSISLWSLLALVGLLLGASWVSAHPAWASSTVQFAVRLAHALPPVLVSLRLFVYGLLQIPTPLLSITLGAGLLIVMMIWAQLINWQRNRLAPLAS